MSVSSRPGQIALTVTPLGATSRASDRSCRRARPSSPRTRSARRCRAGPPRWTRSRSGPTSRGASPRSAALAHRNAPAQVRVHRLLVHVHRVLGAADRPASTRRCSRRPVTVPGLVGHAPERLRARSPRRSRRGDREARRAGRLQRPRPSPSRRARSTGSRSRRVQPASASATAHARPMPREPPVTTATFEVTRPRHRGQRPAHQRRAPREPGAERREHDEVALVHPAGAPGAVERDRDRRRRRVADLGDVDHRASRAGCAAARRPRS